MKKGFLAILGSVFLFSGAASESHGQAAKNEPGAVARLEWIKIRGQVVSIDAQQKKLKLSDPEGNLTDVFIDDNVQILHWYRVVDFEALRPKDKVELRYVGGAL